MNRVNINQPLEAARDSLKRIRESPSYVRENVRLLSKWAIDPELTVEQQAECATLAAELNAALEDG